MQLSEQVEAFKKHGVKVTAISYDKYEILKAFAAARKLKYPLLSDQNAQTVAAFGILNQSYKPGHRNYGLPYPGTYLVDAAGTILSSYTERNYRKRHTPANMLVRAFGPMKDIEKKKVKAEQIQISTWASDTVLSAGNRTLVAVDIVIPARLRLVARSENRDFTGLSLTLTAPKAVNPREPEIADATVKGFAGTADISAHTGKLRILCDISVGQRGEMKGILQNGKFTVKGTLSYQAGTEKKDLGKYTAELEWTFSFK